MSVLMSLLNRAMPPLTLLAGAILLSSCGGGGGSNLPTPTSNAAPGAVYDPTGCDAKTYSPNYISSNSDASDSRGNSFTYWRHFPISVYIPDSTDAATRAATLAGYDEWVAATGRRVSYKLVSSATGADLAVSYAPNNQPADSSGDVTVGLTTVNYTPKVNNIQFATMQLFVLNPDGSPDTVRDANGEVQSIAAHEFGHALGIGPHSLVSDDLMYYLLHNDGVHGEPVTQRDLNTVETIYCNNFPPASGSALERKSAASGGTTRTRTLPPLRRPNRS